MRMKGGRRFFAPQARLSGAADSPECKADCGQLDFGGRRYVVAGKDILDALQQLRNGLDALVLSERIRRPDSMATVAFQVCDLSLLGRLMFVPLIPFENLFLKRRYLISMRFNFRETDTADEEVLIGNVLNQKGKQLIHFPNVKPMGNARLDPMSTIQIVDGFRGRVVVERSRPRSGLLQCPYHPRGSSDSECLPRPYTTLSASVICWPLKSWSRANCRYASRCRAVMPTCCDMASHLLAIGVSAVLAAQDRTTHSNDSQHVVFRTDIAISCSSPLSPRRGFA